MDEAEEAAVWDEYEEVVLGDEGDGEEGEEKDGKDGAGGGIGAEDRRLIKEVRRRRISMICGHGARRIGMICGHGNAPCPHSTLEHIRVCVTCVWWYTDLAI